MADQDEKTEEPTAKKLEKAFEQGNMPVSQEVKTWVMFLGVTALMMGAVPYIAHRLTYLLAGHIGSLDQFSADGAGLRPVIMDLMLEVGLLLAIPGGLFLVLGIAANRLQNPFSFNPEKLTPDLSKISPMKGFKKIFSANNLAEFIKSIVKLVMAAVAVVAVVYPERARLEGLIFTPTGDVAEVIYVMVVRVLIVITILITVIAAVDHAWQVYQFQKSQRMTKQEVKDEHKQADGDPKIKGRLRAIRRERFQKRLAAVIPEADVVVTNPTHYAVALKYRHGEMDVPMLIAKGVDSMALRIRALADEHNIPIVENPPLARALHATVDIDEEIPPDHYKAVAEVISYILKLKKKRFRVDAP